MNIDRVQSELIRLYGSRSGGVRGNQSARGSSETRGADASQGARGDGVTISDEAAVLGRLVGVVAAAPDVREELVSELRSRIQSGNYEPADEAVARRLLGLGDAE